MKVQLGDKITISEAMIVTWFLICTNPNYITRVKSWHSAAPSKKKFRSTEIVNLPLEQFAECQIEKVHANVRYHS